MKIYANKLKNFTKLQEKITKYTMLNKEYDNLKKALDLMRILNFDKFDSKVVKEMLKVVRAIIQDTTTLSDNDRKVFTTVVSQMMNEVDKIENDYFIKNKLISYSDMLKIEE